MYSVLCNDFVHLEEDLGEDGGTVDPLTCVRRAVWGMLYANDAGLVSNKSAEGLEKMMTVICDRFRSRRPHRIRKENGGLNVHAAADTESGTPDLTARHRSSGTEV